MFKVGRWQKFSAVSWKKVLGPAGAVCCELRESGMHGPAWGTFAAGVTLLDCRTVVPMEKFLV